MKQQTILCWQAQINAEQLGSGQILGDRKLILLRDGEYALK